MRLLLLAHLQIKTGPKINTRYQLMTIINQVIEVLDAPYSPGAVYHEIKKLQLEKLIDFNHNFRLTILGEQLLHTELTQTPPPEGLVPLLVRCHVISILTNTNVKETSAKKLVVKMIEHNHIKRKNDSLPSDNISSLNIWRHNISEQTRKLVLHFLAEI